TEFWSGNEQLSFLAPSGDGKLIIAQTQRQQQDKADKREGVPGKLRCYVAASKQLKYEISTPNNGRFQGAIIGDDGKVLLVVAVDRANKGELQFLDFATGAAIRKWEINVDHAARLQLTED